SQDETPKVTSQYDQNSRKDHIADSCQTFNDGCNQCSRSGSGNDEAACTRMFCEVYTEPYCTDDQPAMTDNDFDKVDVSEYIGLSVEDAQKKANDDQRDFRIVTIDGEAQAVTMDLRPGRIN